MCEIHWQRFSVSYDYPVAFTRQLFAVDKPLLADILARREPSRRHRVLFFVDAGLAAARPQLSCEIEDYAARYADRIELVASPFTVAGGERIKSDLSQLEQIQETICRFRLDRHSFVIAVGGGAMLDAVGFAAATVHRGVRHVRIPTTVLAQNDSGVGVKNAVNLNGIKNLIGAFAPPWAVLNDFDLLNDLAPRERIAGVAEAVKVALIRDEEFFTWIEANADRLARFEAHAEEKMIRRCAELHMHQIAHGGDPFEMGSARPLDFGHWAAHKLEALSEYSVRHGEAVAIGIALDARYSVNCGLLAEGSEKRIASLLQSLGFSLWHATLHSSDDQGRPAILAGLRDFQEHLGGDLTVTLLSAIGTGVEVHEIDAEQMMQAAQWLRDRQAASP